MDYPKSVPNVGLVNGKFVDENTTTGQIGSLIPASWGNGVTDELLNVIRAGGKQPAENNNDQLLGAINSIVRAAIPPKENKTTLAEYGINDAYTKAQTDGELNKCIKVGQDVPAYSNPTFNSNLSSDIASIPGNTGSMEISGGTGEASAVIAFHRPGKFASYFGLDTDNQWKVGGWSMGKNAYVLWHAGNFNPATKADVATLPKGIGVGQIWQDVTAARARDVAYTNTTGRSIAVSVWPSNNTRNVMQLLVDGVEVSRSTINDSSLGAISTISAIIPPGSSYMVTSTIASYISKWSELR